MTSGDSVHTSCDRCDAPIRYGDPQVTINRHVEQVAQDKDGPYEEMIDVLESDVMITLCEKCGTRFPVEVLDKALRAVIVP